MDKKITPPSKAGAKEFDKAKKVGDKVSYLKGGKVQTGKIIAVKKTTAGIEYKLDNSPETVKVDWLKEEISHDRYFAVHGKKAKGTGGWAFTNKPRNQGRPDDDEIFWTNGTLAQASKKAKQHFGTKKTIYIMEDTKPKMKVKLPPLNEEFESDVKEMAAQFIVSGLHMVSQFHTHHLMTDTAQIHMATGAFYEGLNSELDGFAEIFLGECDTMATITPEPFILNTDPSLRSILADLNEFDAKVKEIIPRLNPVYDGGLIDKINDIKELIGSTKYQLKLK